MKKMILLFMALPTFAVQVSFIGPCDSTPIISKEISFEKEMTAGQATVQALAKSGFEYEAGESYVRSVNHSPVGLDAMEVLSDTFMRSHGWCYLVDGKMLGVYPDEVKIKASSQIEWYYCFATYKDGTWLDEYYPTHTIKPSQFCD